MIIEIKITASGSKYDELAKTEMSIDSDEIDALAIEDLAKGMAKSVIGRANEKLAKKAQIAPPPAAAAEPL